MTVTVECSGEGYRVVGDMKNTDRIMSDALWVGTYPGMIDYMAEMIGESV